MSTVRSLGALLAALCAGLLLCAVVPAVAAADGDPGSDELLAQNLFTGDADVTVGQQLALGGLLTRTAAVGAPVRVAIIPDRSSLGYVTSLWGRPQPYAEYLGTELSDTYGGRLLVVMPDGYGFYWHGHSVSSWAAALHVLSGAPAPGTSPAGLVDAATEATERLEAAAGIPAARLARAAASGPGVDAGQGGGAPTVAPAGATTPSGTVSSGSPGWLVALVLLAALSSVWWAPRLWRARRSAGPVLHAGRDRIGVPYVAIWAPLLLLAILAGVVHSLGPASSSASTLANNPNLDPGTSLTAHARQAPDFTLVDETGHAVSLRQYRGKVVILSFVDDECQTICPLTTTAMLDAKRALGPAAADVVLLGVDANWKSRQIDDVLNYTDLHGMQGQWHFLTGSLPQLDRVWDAYGLGEFTLLQREQQLDRARGYGTVDFNDIDHVPATFVIGPSGELETVYQTQDSYAAIPQLGQLMAQEASRLLPSHPAVSTHYSYAEVPGIAPSVAVTLPRAGGGTVTLGPGTPHLYVFFATWDVQTTALAQELESLNAYAWVARREGLPSPVAVDEGSVEPGPSALTAFLATLPSRLRYPVAIDRTGTVADGYGVDGDPWLVLTSRAGVNVWNREVYTEGWPSLASLRASVAGALKSVPGGPLSSAEVARDLSGSPAPLAALHAQAADVLGGGVTALRARIAALRGHPVVVNIWYSTCSTCVAEAGRLANASARYGRRVAFIGLDFDDPSAAASEFMREHGLSYPTYLVGSVDPVDTLLPGGLQGTPTTIYYSARGDRVQVRVGEYGDQASLDSDIETYALGQ